MLNTASGAFRALAAGIDRWPILCAVPFTASATSLIHGFYLWAVKPS